MDKALAADPNEMRSYWGETCVRKQFRRIGKPGKIYTTGTNRNFTIVACFPASAFLSISCVIVLLARDVHYAFV